MSPKLWFWLYFFTVPPPRTTHSPSGAFWPSSPAKIFFCTRLHSASLFRAFSLLSPRRRFLAIPCPRVFIQFSPTTLNPLNSPPLPSKTYVLESFSPKRFCASALALPPYATHHHIKFILVVRLKKHPVFYTPFCPRFFLFPPLKIVCLL